MRLALLTPVTATVLAWPPAAEAHRAIDGDTVKLDSGEACRLYGVDAEEARQPLGQAARDALAELMAHAPDVTVRGRDRYGRSLCALTLADGDTINRELVRQGLAERIAVATEHGLKGQQWQRGTEDVSEGIHAVAERRAGRFKGR